MLAGCSGQVDSLSSPTTEGVSAVVQPTEGSEAELLPTNADLTTPAADVSSPTEQATTPTHQALNQMLGRQTEAILSSDIAGHLDTFRTALHEEQQTLFERLQSLPFASYTFQVDPNERLSAAHTGELRAINVRLSYTFAGIPEDNVFQHDLDMDFWFSEVLCGEVVKLAKNEKWQRV